MDRGKHRFRVVINHEEQYSIWPEDRKNVRGWKDGGFAGSKDACLKYIEKVWTDLRPLSLRERKQKHQQMEARIRRDAGS